MSFFWHGNFSSVTCTHALFLSFLPLVFPLWHEIDLSILIVLLLYPNWLVSGLSLRLPSCHCLPNNSSAGSWQNRSVRTYSIPSWRRNLVDSMVDWKVSWKPLYVCQERNMCALAFWLKFPGLFLVLSFQLLRYSRNSIKNWNLWKDLIDYCRKKRQIPQYWLILSNRLIKPQKYITDLNPKKYRRCKFSN